MEKHSRPDPQSQVAFPIARAGWFIIFMMAFITAVFALLGLAIPALSGLALTIFVCFFFRDPDRRAPATPNTLVSPADGKVIFAGEVEDTPFFSGKSMKISIFMTVFNVHVNRMPCAGVVERIKYHSGKFFAAHLPKASLDNEHNAIFIETPEGKKVCVVQIAGLIARRIICYVQAGDDMPRGERFGIICFGSRVDLYLPPESNVTVAKGAKVQAGSSVLGQL